MTIKVAIRILKNLEGNNDRMSKSVSQENC